MPVALEELIKRTNRIGSLGLRSFRAYQTPPYRLSQIARRKAEGLSPESIRYNLKKLRLEHLKPSQMRRIKECEVKRCDRIFWAGRWDRKVCDRHRGKAAAKLRMERKRRRDGVKPRSATWGDKRRSRYALELLDYRILIEISHGYRKVDTITSRPEVLSLIGWVTPPKGGTWANLSFDERVDAKRALVKKRLTLLEKVGNLKKTSRDGYDLTDGGVYACDEARWHLRSAGYFRDPQFRWL